MRISFEGPAVMVRDVAACREFYEGLLGQEVLFAVGENYVAYATKFSLWAQGCAAENIYGAAAPAAVERQGMEVFELYFETEELDAAWDKLGQTAPVVHGIREQPWGQRMFRVRDPEGNVVELGEPMPFVARRFLGQGLSPEETSQRTMLPLPLILAIQADAV